MSHNPMPTPMPINPATIKPNQNQSRRAGCFGRGKAVAQVATEEAGDTAHSGELGEVGVEIHAVDALQFHDDVFALELGDRGR
jgi:hypothetical protein